MNKNLKIIGISLLLMAALYYGIRYEKLHEQTRFSDNIARYEAVNAEILSRLHIINGSLGPGAGQPGFNNDTSAHGLQLIQELFRDSLVYPQSQFGYINTSKDSLISYTVKAYYSHWLKETEHQIVYDPHNHYPEDGTYYCREIKPNWKYIITRFNWPYN